MKLYCIVFEYTLTEDTPELVTEDVYELSDQLFNNRQDAEHWATAQISSFPPGTMPKFRAHEFDVPDGTVIEDVVITSEQDGDDVIDFASDGDANPMPWEANE